MNTRKTFNGKKPKRRYHTPASVLMAAVIVLASVTVAAWIGVIGLYASDNEPGGRYGVKGNDFKVTVQPSDLHQGQIDDGGYK